MQEQVPTEFVVVFLLRTDVEHYIGDRQHLRELVAVGEVVAVEVGRIDEDFLLQRRPIVRRQLAELQSRIEKIGLYRDRITVKNLDGIAFLDWVFVKCRVKAANALVYMDPPYFEKAVRLYDVYFHDSDHQKLAEFLGKSPS